MADTDHCATHPAKPPNASCYAYCRCRCPGCREAKRLKDRQAIEARRRITPLPTHKVSAARAREVLQRAYDRGYTDRQLADACKLTHERVWEIRNNRRTTVLRRTGGRIVAAVHLLEQHDQPDRADGLVVRAMLTWLRDRGAPDHWLAGQLKMNASHVWQLRHGHYRQPRRPTADRVAKLRDEVLAGRIVPPGHGANARLEQGAGR